MVFKYILISALVATSFAYTRPKSSHSTHFALFGEAPDIEAIKAEQDVFAADEGELYDDVDTSLNEDVTFVDYSAGPLRLGDAGTGRRGGGRGGGKGGKRGKFQGGKKGEYTIEEGDFETGSITKPQGPPMPEHMVALVSKIFDHLDGNSCTDGCSRHCTFDNTADNVKHHPCRKCVRMECKDVVKKFMHANGGGKRGKRGKGGKGGSKGGKGDMSCRRSCLASSEVKSACSNRRSKECKGAVRGCFRAKCS